MKEVSRYRWIIGAVIFLAIMNISTIATILYNRSQSLAIEESENSPDLTESENTSIDYSGRYFRDRLNLSRDQMDLFVQFNPIFRQQARTINTNLGRIRHQMLSEMAADESDIKFLDMLSDSIGILHSDLKKLTNQYYLDIKNICNEDQQKRLEEMFSEMFSSTVHNDVYKIRGPNGRRYGRRFNNLPNE